MGSKEAIQQTFREYCITHPYGDISIAELCAAAGVSKKTFYKYFESKQAVLEQVILEDVVERSHALLSNVFPEQRVGLTALTIEVQFRIFYQNREFYAALFKSKSRSSVRKICENLIYRYGKTLYGNNSEDQPVDSVELDYACWFFASSMVSSLEWWINNDFEPDVQKMAEMYNHWVYAYNRENGTFSSHPENSSAAKKG